jgi:hypothetical protein
MLADHFASDLTNFQIEAAKAYALIMWADDQ